MPSRPSWSAPDGARRALYLHTSPEFACKKLLAAGEPRIFDFARVFRNRERGALHAPEFTMLEWYRAGEPYEALMADCAALLPSRRDAAARTTLHLSRPQRRSVRARRSGSRSREAFARHAGIDLLATLRRRRAATATRSPRRPRRAGIRRRRRRQLVATSSANAGRERIEPQLGYRPRRPSSTEYPRGEAALARAKPDDPRVAERFELYACGVELANGFGELTDPAEQRRRFEAEMAEKQRVYGERYPIDEDFLAALARCRRPAAWRSASTGW